MTPLIFAIALAAAEAQSAPTPAQPPGSAAQKPVQPADKVVCRSQSIDGTRFERRVCKPRSQWDAEHAEAQRLLRARPGVGSTNAQPGF